MPRARRRSWAAGQFLQAAIAGLMYFFWPSTLGGCSTLTIVSGESMEPTYSTGDLVWSRCGEASVGDVVVYTPEDTGNARVIHRIVGGDGENGWVLQGDNNDFLDPWNPNDSQIVGIAAVHIPRMGSVLYSLQNPFIWGSLLLMAAALALWPQTKEDESSSGNPGAEDASGAGTEPDRT